jgi:ABC-type Mn2+/Zn2+ transport system permease subunit
MAITTLELLLVGATTAIAASAFGVFVILRRMALTADALTHVALPGLALGILYSFNPFLGGFAMLLVGVLIVLWIEERTGIATETAIGLLFTAALAIGALLIPEESLIEALFGSIHELSLFEFWILLGVSVAIGASMFAFFRPFCRISFSQEFAAAEGLNAKRYYVLYLLLLAALVAVGIRLVGSLLMGALIIFPAAAAKNLAGSLRGMTIIAMGIGAVSAMIGLWLASAFGLLPGAAVVLSALVIYLLTLLVPRR